MENIVAGEQQEHDILEEIDWESFLQSIPDPVLLFTDDNDLDLHQTEPRCSIQESAIIEASNPSSNSDSSWFGDIEHFLLQEDSVVEDNSDFSEDFFSGILLSDQSREVSPRKEEISGLDVQSREVSPRYDEIPSPETKSIEENEKEKSDASEEDNGDEDGPLSKKQKRQMRNRDSAMRSRERKKVYVRELEMKSKYLEGECKRLEYALRCCVMENQILYQRLQNKDKAFGVSSAKQESAVLPLESLLLGSLFWLVSIVCLVLLSVLPLTKKTMVRTAGSVGGSNSREIAGVREAENEVLRLEMGLDFMKRKFKATRTKMKAAIFDISPHSFLVRTVFG
ncbi:hypothetical protein AAC387_Pa02g1201 [Persea americana]